MNYLFFDTECARGHGGICEFGYVVTDESFNVLKTENLLINPKMRFDDYGHLKAGIIFAYSKDEYYSAPDIVSRYKTISTLLGDKNNVIIGYATDSDAKFLLNDFERDYLPDINYTFWDVMKMYKLIADRNSNLKLDVLYAETGAAELMHHEALSDALMTIEVFKKLLKDYNLTADKVFTDYPSASAEVFKKRIVYNDGSVFNYTKGNRTTPANKKFVDELIKCRAISRLNDNLQGKIVSIAPDIVKDNFAVTLAVCLYTKYCGGEFTLSICSANYLLVNPGYKPPQGRLRRGVKLLGISAMEKLLGLEENSLNAEKIDPDKIIATLPENKFWYEAYLSAHGVAFSVGESDN